ncbi:MAG: hypothetical protein GTO45_09735 [Candidatus Aminicenantes bacterium]|nr:hypothetical protein [Candidatus Aminicenantes bacterium]NIM79096.1 hypothetical protein [Candidatus Aminicenantes bacterium]NIN18375.1 hypothetical protein [Candidatus Aminicenantes bacterium]NIN42262.1 hypothetical protein [Candidatus Aminicenantes bacterium]NIN85028.1 hypothetical protein [Candidatus Aminicenantes bacterium]
MLRKEVKDVSRQSGYFIISIVVGTFLVLVGFAFARSFPSYVELFWPVYQLGLLIFSLFLGISLFAVDIRDDGMEYLLTLPYSRLQLLMYKTVPRAAALILCYGLYLLLTAVLGRGLDMQVFTVPMFFYLCVSLFVIGVSFSVFRGSFIISAIATGFIFVVYLAVVRYLYPLVWMLKVESPVGLKEIMFWRNWWETPVSVYFAGFSLLVGFAAAFVYAFKRFELGSPGNFTRRYLKVFIPIVVFALVVSLFWAYREAPAPPKHYYLTANNQLIETGYMTTRIYHKRGVSKIDSRFLYLGSFVEKGRYLYAHNLSWSGSEILKIDPVNNTDEIVYRARGDNRLWFFIYSYKDTIAAIEGDVKEGTRILVLIDTGTKSIKRIKVAENIKKWNTYYPRVFAADEADGKRFWLLYSGTYGGWSIQAAWEDGTLESLGNSAMRPVYANGMLITRDNKQLVFKRITTTGTELIDTKALPVGIEFHFRRASTNNLDRGPTSELYGVVTEDIYDIYKDKIKKALRVDLKTLDVTEVKSLEGQRGMVIHRHPDTWYFVKKEYDPAAEEPILKALYRLNQEKLELVKEFEPMSISYTDSRNYFEVYDTGYVLKKNGKISVYSLPGLQPIMFDELK